MADNDIYNNKGKYDYFVENLNLILIPPDKRKDSAKQGDRY